MAFMYSEKETKAVNGIYRKRMLFCHSAQK